MKSRSQQCFQFDDCASAVSSRKAVCSQEESGDAFYSVIHIKLRSEPLGSLRFRHHFLATFTVKKTNKNGTELKQIEAALNFTRLPASNPFHGSPAGLRTDVLHVQELDSAQQNWGRDEAGPELARSGCHQKQRSSLALNVICLLRNSCFRALPPCGRLK